MKKTEILAKTREYQEFMDALMQLVAVNHFSVAVKSTVESYTQLFINKTRQFEYLLFGSHSDQYTLTQYSWGSPITKPGLRIDRDEKALQMRATNYLAAVKDQINDWTYTEPFIEDASDAEPSVITKTEQMTTALGLMRTYINAIDTAVMNNTPSDAS